MVATRGKTKPVKIKESKELTVQTPDKPMVMAPVDPLYELSPLERARQLPDVRGDFSTELFRKQLALYTSKTLPELNAISTKARNLSVQELMIIQYMTHALKKENEDFLDRTDKLLDRVHGKASQRIEHSGAISTDTAMLMEAVKGIDDISIEEMQAIADLAKSNLNAKLIDK